MEACWLWLVFYSPCFCCTSSWPYMNRFKNIFIKIILNITLQCGCHGQSELDHGNCSDFWDCKGIPRKDGPNTSTWDGPECDIWSYRGCVVVWVFKVDSAQTISLKHHHSAMRMECRRVRRKISSNRGPLVYRELILELGCDQLRIWGKI